MRVEQRGGGLRQRESETRPYAARTLTVTTKFERFTSMARNEPQTRFNSLMGLLTEAEGLRESFERQNGTKAPGVDGVRKDDYAAGLEERLDDLSARLRRLGYIPQPVRRAYIPKGDGRYRPLGVPSFEDRLVQDRLSRILQAIWEPEFCDCSYGFRPGRSAHDALRRVAEVITNGQTQWVVEADIKGFFDHLSHTHLIRFLEHRIADPNLLRIVHRFLKAGVMEDGVFANSDEGAPQGGLVSPVLSNIYLHYVLDEWYEQEVRPRLKGRSFLIRYADDFVMGFSSEDDARRVLEVLPKRFGKYGLTLHPEKTRIVAFKQPDDRDASSGTPGTFDLLGFTHYWGKSRRGYWVVKRGEAPRGIGAVQPDGAAAATPAAAVIGPPVMITSTSPTFSMRDFSSPWRASSTSACFLSSLSLSDLSTSCAHLPATNSTFTSFNSIQYVLVPSTLCFHFLRVNSGSL